MGGDRKDGGGAGGLRERKTPATHNTHRPSIDTGPAGGPATTVGLGYRAFGACGGGGGLASRRALLSAVIWGKEEGGVYVQWRL